MKMKQYCVGRSFQCYTCFVAYLHKVKVDILVKICSSTKKHTKLRPFSRAAMLSFRIFTLELWVFFTQIPRKSAEISWKLIKRFSPQIISHLGGWIIYKRSKKTRTWRLQLRHLRKFWKHHRFFLEKTWCGSRILHEKHTPKKNFEKHLHDLSWLRPGFRTSVRLPLHVDGQDLSHQNHSRGWLGKAGVFFLWRRKWYCGCFRNPAITSWGWVGFFPSFSGGFSTIQAVINPRRMSEASKPYDGVDPGAPFSSCTKLRLRGNPSQFSP